MASSTHHHQCSSSMEQPCEIIADAICLRAEFTELYEQDYHHLLQCIERLHCIIKKFEQQFRSTTKGCRDAGMAGIAGVTTMITGLALVPFTMGASVAVAGAGAAATLGGAIYGRTSSTEKQCQKTQLRKDIEAEIKKFQHKIQPMAEKLKEISEHIEKIMKDINKLEQEASDLYKYFASASKKKHLRERWHC